MATINKIYPHVQVTTTALARTYAQAVESGATTLFVPFYSKKGLNNEVQKIYNLNQFITEYGNPDFDYQGRGVLNIYNWLSAGGAIYALRLTAPDAVKATDATTAFGDGNMVVTAKYPGAYYNDISLFITESNYSTDIVKYADVQILLDGSRITSLYRVKYAEFATLVSSTGYVDVTITSAALETDYITFITAAGDTGTTVTLISGSDGTFTFEDTLQRFFGSVTTELTSTTSGVLTTTVPFPVDNDDYLALNWSIGDSINITSTALTSTAVITNYVSGTLTVLAVGTEAITTAADWTLSFNTEDDIYISAEKIISNKLELPIDVFLDPGYSQASKALIKDFAEDFRDDIFFYFSEVDFSTYESGSFEGALVFEGTSNSEINQAIYTQKFIVEDIISDTNLWVAPTYFLASLLPYNDRIYGLQWPTAGLTRGVLTGVDGININPTSAKKTSNILAKINYVEKDSRGYTFMAQLTGELENTALQYISNVRVVNRIVRDLENLGREYLFEFNDATTLTNMRNALTRYTDEWIQNRTLEYAVVQVEKDEYSDERVNVNLTIKFVGIIDVISIDITIE